MKRTLTQFSTLKKLFFLSAILFFSTSFSFGQRTCGTMENLEMRMQQDPGLKMRMEEMENDIKNIKGNNSGSRAVFTIPVVFHVVYRTATENISDARLIEQLNILTEDFRRLNADKTNTPAGFLGIAGDTEIEFCLAQQDPLGNPSTGITRTLTTVTAFNTNDAVKFNAQGGKDVWDRNKYLNIWVCNLGNSLLGYAQFPGGAAATDGVVCHYKYTGKTGATAPFNKGRTATHEVGHFFNLRHIWGDANCGNDQVADTPVQQDENYGCPTYPLSPNSCSTTNSNGDMFMNYMDYSDDGCMNAFSVGQGTRMQASLNLASRVGLKNSIGCQPVNLALNDAGISAIVSPSGSSCDLTFIPVVTLKNFGSNTLTSAIINFNIDGGTNQTFNYSGTLASQATVNITLTSMTTNAGNHTFNAFTTMPNGVADSQSSNDNFSAIFTILGGATSVALPYLESFEGTFVPSGWQLVNPDNNLTWTKSAAAGGFANTPSSARMDNFSTNITGQSDYLYTPFFNLSTAQIPITVDFSVAYARYSAANHDSLIVSVSIDCGATWTRHYAKGNILLSTNGGTNVTTSFVPNASQWRAESINLDAYTGNANVRIAFQNKSGYGNHLYIDDIAVNESSITGIERNQAPSTGIAVYPNPSKGELFIQTNNAERNTVKISIFNTLGEIIANESNSNNKSGNYYFDMNNYPNGIYLINIETSKGVTVKKMILAK